MYFFKNWIGQWYFIISEQTYSLHCNTFRLNDVQIKEKTRKLLLLLIIRYYKPNKFKVISYIKIKVQSQLHVIKLQSFSTLYFSFLTQI